MDDKYRMRNFKRQSRVSQRNFKITDNDRLEAAADKIASDGRCWTIKRVSTEYDVYIILLYIVYKCDRAALVSL